MAALFIDGMDHYAAADARLKWPAGSTWDSMQTGLLGTGQCGRIGGGSVTRILASNYTTFIIGFRFRTGALTTGTFMRFMDASSNVIATITQTAAGGIAWYRGNQSTQVAVSANGIIGVNAVNYLEFKVTLATGATGTIQARMNGADIIPSTGSVQTANTTASMNSLQILGSGVTNDYDDLYLFDTTGSQNNDFAGDSKIVTVMPNGAGRLTQWSVTGAASNYLAVNDATPNGDTSYVSTSTAGNIDCYTLASAGSPSAVKCVQINTDIRKDDVTTRTVAHGVGNGTTENFDAGTNLGTSYTYLIRTLDTNPLTSAAWATSDLSTLQSAIKCIA